jgi:hypothetical protein
MSCQVVEERVGGALQVALELLLHYFKQTIQSVCELIVTLRGEIANGIHPSVPKVSRGLLDGLIPNSWRHLEELKPSREFGFLE